MATPRYPTRKRKASHRWMPKETTEKDLKDDDWGSDVDMEDESEEELRTDDSIQEFIADDDTDDSVTFADDTDDSVTFADDDDTLTLESSDSELELDDDSDAFVSRRTPSPAIPPAPGSSPHLSEDPQDIGNVPAHPTWDIP